MAYCHWNCGDNRRLPDISCAPNNRAGTDHLYRGLGAHDWRNRNCVRNQVASRDQGRMVFDPYGSGIHRLCHTASVESYRWRRRGHLAHRMVCGCPRRSRHLFWLPPPQPADVGSLLRVSYQANGAGLGSFRGVRHALFPCALLFLRDKAGKPAGLLNKIRLGAIDGAITLRRWNMSLLILRVEFEIPRILGRLIVYEENCLYSPPPISQ